MIVAIDYDYTYTLDPKLWNAVIELMQANKHTVYCVTARHYWNNKDVYATIGRVADYVVFTDKRAKKPHMLGLGIQVDVWIDDTPEAILMDKIDYAPEKTTKNHN